MRRPNLWHVVLIGGTKYKSLFTAFDENAAANALEYFKKTEYRHSCFVVRDGKTGHRKPFGHYLTTWNHDIKPEFCNAD